MNDSIPTEVEIKYAVHPEDRVTAFNHFNLDGREHEEYKVYFFDTEDLELFAKGLILRCRQRSDPGKDDSTFKVRGDKGISAFQRFGVEMPGAKFEGDLNVGGSEQPSYSITHKLPPPPPLPIKDFLEGKVGLLELFGQECAKLVAEAVAEGIGEIKIYGPVLAKKWNNLKVEGLGKIDAELWQAGGELLLEISDKKDRGEDVEFAEKLRVHMEELAKARQLDGSKTQFALERMRQPRAFPKGVA